jgi:thiol-disulfide isomerase/thioredoxin
MKKSYVFTLLFLVVIVSVAGLITYYFFTVPNDKANSEASKSLASDEVSVYTDLEGNPVTFEAYEGKVRIVNSWASWTPFSQTELQDFESLAQEYVSRDVAFLAINRKEPKEIAKQYLKTLPEFKHTIFIIDVTDAYYKSIGGYAMPETVIYNAVGEVVFHKRGQLSRDDMKTYIETALSQSN